MYSNMSSAKPLTVASTRGETETSPTFTELTKKMQFFRFLQREINTVKTEAEKEAVLTILMKTKIQIRALEQEWKQIQSLHRTVQTGSQTVSDIYPHHRIQ